MSIPSKFFLSLLTPDEATRDHIKMPEVRLKGGRQRGIKENEEDGKHTLQCEHLKQPGRFKFINFTQGSYQKE